MMAMSFESKLVVVIPHFRLDDLIYSKHQSLEMTPEPLDRFCGGSSPDVFLLAVAYYLEIVAFLCQCCTG